MPGARHTTKRAVGLSVVAVIVSGSVFAASVGPSDPEGVRLAIRVNAAYGGVPGIRATATVRGQRATGEVAIVGAVAVAMVTRVPGGTAVDVRAGQFVRVGTSTCWKRTGDPEQFGHRVIDTRYETVGRPRRRGRVIVVRRSFRARDAGKVVEDLRIDAHTLRILSATAISGGSLSPGVVTTYTSLSHTPTIPKPTPRCPRLTTERIAPQ